MADIIASMEQQERASPNALGAENPSPSAGSGKRSRVSSGASPSSSWEDFNLESLMKKGKGENTSPKETTSPDPAAEETKSAPRRQCARTDGRSWRCRRDCVPTLKYCQQHMHRGSKRAVASWGRQGHLPPEVQKELVKALEDDHPQPEWARPNSTCAFVKPEDSLLSFTVAANPPRQGGQQQLVAPASVLASPIHQAASAMAGPSTAAQLPPGPNHSVVAGGTGKVDGGGVSMGIDGGDTAIAKMMAARRGAAAASASQLGMQLQQPPPQQGAQMQQHQRGGGGKDVQYVGLLVDEIVETHPALLDTLLDMYGDGVIDDSGVGNSGGVPPPATG